MTRQRMPAAERREMVLEAAVAEFAAGGLAGTSTEGVARRAGISQPYLFRLFPTKKALFLALVERCFRRVEDTFTAAAGDLTGDEAMTAMADSYTRLLDDRIGYEDNHWTSRALPLVPLAGFLLAVPQASVAGGSLDFVDAHYSGLAASDGTIELHLAAHGYLTATLAAAGEDLFIGLH